jgi:hypothetical protein
MMVFDDSNESDYTCSVENPLSSALVRWRDWMDGGR